MEIKKALVVIVWRPEIASSEKKVLLLRLIPGRGAYWQPVTGRVEKGESFEEGALREAQEETGLAFDRLPQFLGLEQVFPGREGSLVRERSFYLPLLGGRAPPTPVLDGKEHDAFGWLPPVDAAARVKWPGNRLAVERASAGSPPLLLSRRGIFMQEGEEITHERTAETLHRSLTRTASGHFVVRMESEELEVIVEDNPRLVTSYDPLSGEMALSGGAREKLQPETLRARSDHSLTCRLANGWEATFLSPAYYALSQDIREDSVSGKYVLHFLGRDYDLGIANEGEGKDR